MSEADPRSPDLTRAVIGAFYRVYNTLGHGFLERRYIVALERELRDIGHHVAREYAARIFYKGEEIGYHRLDMVVDLRVVVEVKSTEQLASFARRRLYNELRATNLEVGLLLHFGPRPRVVRIFVKNDPANRPRTTRARDLPVAPLPPDPERLMRDLEEVDHELAQEFEETPWLAVPNYPGEDDDYDVFDDLDDPDNPNPWKGPDDPDDPPVSSPRGAR